MISKTKQKSGKYNSSKMFKDKKSTFQQNILPLPTQKSGIFQNLFSLIKNFYYKMIKKFNE